QEGRDRLHLDPQALARGPGRLLVVGDGRTLAPFLVEVDGTVPERDVHLDRLAVAENVEMDGLTGSVRGDPAQEVLVVLDDVAIDLAEDVVLAEPGLVSGPTLGHLRD